MVGTEQRMRAYQCIWQGIEPAEHCVDATLPYDRPTILCDQARSKLKVCSCQRVLHRFSKHPVLLVPHTGAMMELRYQRRLGLTEVAAQHLGKQMMVTVPAPLLVECDDKQVRL